MKFRTHFPKRRHFMHASSWLSQSGRPPGKLKNYLIQFAICLHREALNHTCSIWLFQDPHNTTAVDLSLFINRAVIMWAYMVMCVSDTHHMQMQIEPTYR